MDDLMFEITEDGTIKTTTSKVGAANHQNADEFIKMIGRLCGGAVSTEKRKEGHAHTHSHAKEVARG